MSLLLGAGVLGTSASFRYSPSDVLRRILYITRLAMNTVRRINLELCGTRVILDVLVNTSRTEPGLDPIEEGQVPGYLDGVIG